MSINELIHENSPYLRQHAHNPVHWKAWSDRVLAQAQKENKLLLVSIGYSACHWCHVMEKECFEDKTIAEFMNYAFMNIKIDREERPDIDAFYMDALLLMNGHGGWPLNIICLPDGKPIYGGTYFPKDKWIALIQQLHTLWLHNPEKTHQYAQQLMEGLNELDTLIPIKKQENIQEEEFIKIALSFQKYFDMENGGLGQAPKFPTPWNWIFIHRTQAVYPTLMAQKALTLTLDQMAYGGIFDAVGGGFSRYSTDERWHIPHFEKMLYDNVLLLQLYTEVWKKKPNKTYKNVIFKTLHFLESELLNPERGFYTALDADSEGEEGKFYVWTKKEWDSLVSPENMWIADYFNIQAEGNWVDGQNVMQIKLPLEIYLKQKKLPLTELQAEQTISEVCDVLLAYRNQRVKPNLDDKILTSWNGLAIRAYTEVLKIAFSPERLSVIEKIAHRIWEQAVSGSTLYRIKTQTQAIPGFLDDYAYMIDGYLGLFELTGNEIWYIRAYTLATYVEEQFYEDEKNTLYYTEADTSLWIRKTDYYDSVMPSSAAIMVHNWLHLATLSGKIAWFNLVEKIFSAIRPEISVQPTRLASWADIYRQLCYPTYELVITGKEARAWAMELFSMDLPQVKIYYSIEPNAIPVFQNRFQDQTLAYICSQQSCLAPVHSIAEILLIIQSHVI